MHHFSDFRIDNTWSVAPIPSLLEMKNQIQNIRKPTYSFISEKRSRYLQIKMKPIEQGNATTSLFEIYHQVADSSLRKTDAVCFFYHLIH